MDGRINDSGVARAFLPAKSTSRDGVGETKAIYALVFPGLKFAGKSARATRLLF
jgi:hypothetical protein